MAAFIDTEKRKKGNKRTQNIASLMRVNTYISREDKVGIIDKNTGDAFSSKDEGSLIEEMLNRKDDMLFNYIAQNKKTEQKLITGINCRPSSAFDEMMLTKRIFNKTDRRQFKHFVHSYSKYEKGLTPEVAHEITLKLLEHKKFKDFQILVATHTDTDTIHSHIVINSVNMETGLKWNHSTRDMANIRELSNKLCKEYGLKHSFANTESNKYTKNKYKSMGELKAHEKGQSWKTETFYTILECKKISTSKEEFIENLEKLNYKVRWVDERKDITFTLPNGRKINNDKFHPKDIFTKESLLKQFQLNSEFQERTQKFNAKIKSENLQELYFRTTQFLFENPEEGNKDYPMTYLEGQALKERMIEEAKGRGLDFKEGQER